MAPTDSIVVRLRREYSRTGAYATEATCRHGVHPYDCRQGCAPPTFEAADEIERLRKWLERISIQVGGQRRNLKAELMRDMALNALKGEHV